MTRKTFVPLAVFLVLSAGVCSAAKVVGSGHVTTESRTVAAVQEVELAGVGDLTITQGDAESLTVEAEDNLLPLIETTVTKGHLKIGVKAGSTLAPTKRLVFKLAVKNLNKIVLAGSGDINVAKLVSPNPLDARLTGSGDLELNGVDCPAFSLSLSGSGDADLTGKTKEQTVEIAGSGDYDATELQSEKAKVSIAGSGNCALWASGKLDVNIAGSGSVGYRGTPALTKKIAGAGSVHPITENKDGGKKEDKENKED